MAVDRLDPPAPVEEAIRRLGGGPESPVPDAAESPVPEAAESPVPEAAESAETAAPGSASIEWVTPNSERSGPDPGPPVARALHVVPAPEPDPEPAREPRSREADARMTAPDVRSGLVALGLVTTDAAPENPAHAPQEPLDRPRVDAEPAGPTIQYRGAGSETLSPSAVPEALPRSIAVPAAAPAVERPAPVASLSEPTVDPPPTKVPDEPTPSPLERMRAATQQSIERLIATPPAPGPVGHPAPADDRTAVHPPAPVRRPSIAELSRQVERAITGADHAERYRLEVEGRARAAAADIIAESASEAQRALESARAESDSLVRTAAAEAQEVRSTAQVERDAIIARADAHARSIIAHAEVELDRRIRRIVALTEGITAIAQSAETRLGDGTLSATQIAQFIAALGTVTEQALEQIAAAERAAGAPTSH